MSPRARRAVSHWRSKGPTGLARVCWTVIFWAGYAVWTWLVYDWAAEHGHQLLLGGYHPWYLAVAAVTYWPVACSLWWSMYSKAGPVPWLRG